MTYGRQRYSRRAIRASPAMANLRLQDAQLRLAQSSALVSTDLVALYKGLVGSRDAAAQAAS